MEYKGYQVGLSYRFSLIRAFRDLLGSNVDSAKRIDKKGRHCVIAMAVRFFNYRLMAATKAVSVQFLIFAGIMLSPMI